MNNGYSFPLYKQHDWESGSTSWSEVPYLELTLAFTVFIFVLEAYLDIRQLLKFYSGATLPKDLKSYVTQETFDKSIAYGKDKFSFKMVESTFAFIEGVAFILLGYLPFVWDMSEQYALQLKGLNLLGSTWSSLFQEIVITWIFVVLLTCFDTFVNLPFSLYSTFIVEEKHGFNKSTLGLFFQDKIMTLALTFVLGMPILSLVIWIVRIGGEHFYFYVWVFLFFVSVILMTVYPTLIAPLFNKYTPLEDGEVKTAIEGTAPTLASQSNSPNPCPNRILTILKMLLFLIASSSWFIAARLFGHHLIFLLPISNMHCNEPLPSPQIWQSV